MALTQQHKKAPTIHQQKRHGRHHQTNDKHYAKHYWPYLPLLLIVGIGIAISSALSPRHGVLGYATDVSPVTLLQETNIERGANQEPALTLNDQLATAAQNKADDMAARNYWSHDTPDGVAPWQFVTNAGYDYQAVGENLAYGFANSDATVAAWMSSPGHRANLLNIAYREVGFGIANIANYQNEGAQTIVVAMYGNPDPTTVGVAARVAGPTGEVKSAQQIAPSASTATIGATLTATPVSRVSAWTGLSWAGTALLLVAMLSIILFFVKHGLHWRRVLVKGERFIVKHQVLDYAFIITGVVGFVLTRTTGVIH